VPTVPGGTVLALGRAAGGQLARGDATLSAGEFYDDFTLAVQAGRQYRITMQSDAIDTYLIVGPPGGGSEQNDDAEGGGGTDSEVVFTAAQSGTATIRATSFAPGEAGAYTVRAELAGNAQADASPAASFVSSGALALGREVAGTLARGENTLDDGSFMDMYAFQGQAGQRVEFTMTSATFDTFLVVTGPGDFIERNDDGQGAADGTNSRLVVTLPRAGTYAVHATSFEGGVTGAYRLMARAAGAAQPVVAARTLQPGRTASGALASAGEDAGVDRWTVQGRAGERVRIAMDSDAFDTVVSLVAPSGARERNDDSPRGGTNSLIETTFAEDGAYVVEASSFTSDGAGAYSLTLETGSEAADTSREVDPPATAGGRLVAGTPVSGTLAQADAQLDSGEFVDSFTFEGRRGQAVTVDLESTAFDPYLIIVGPGDAKRENDDLSDTVRNSRIVWTLPADGRYTVAVTSFAAGERGAYRLRLATGQSGDTPVVASNGRVFGVFVGISDYPGSGNDLPYTREDAEKLHQALRREGLLADQSELLVDAQATEANVRAAIRRVAAAAGPEDTFLVFYSGHGMQERQTGATSAEADGMDETIALYQGEIIDDEMATLMAGTRARVSLLTLDACFSGGFARDVVSRPGIMGLFSSEEDLTSQVASKFEAGGYLSHFLRTGLSGDGDVNGDRELTAGELSAYLRRAFAEQASDVSAETIDGQSNYQFLVVERGGVKIDDRIIALPRA
jgi:plastocyanin